MHLKKCKNGVFRAFSLNKMSLLCGVIPLLFYRTTTNYNKYILFKNNNTYTSIHHFQISKLQEKNNINSYTKVK